MKAPKTIDVKLKLHVLEISGSWEPSNAERKAAWEIYIELITRISVVPLDADHGSVREALTSLYSLFGTTREVLRRHGPEIAESKRESGRYSLGYLAVAILNFELRPVLARWHPALEEWESRRSPTVSKIEHERSWEQAVALRADLERVRVNLADYAELLAAASGVPHMIPAIVLPAPTKAGPGEANRDADGDGDGDGDADAEPVPGPVSAPVSGPSGA